MSVFEQHHHVHIEMPPAVNGNDSNHMSAPAHTPYQHSDEDLAREEEDWKEILKELCTRPNTEMSDGVLL